MRLIIEQIKRHKAGFFIAISFLTLEAVCDLLQPMVMSRIVDEGVAQNDAGLIARLGALMLGIALLGAVGALVRNYFAGKVSNQIGLELRGTLYRKVQTFSFENLDRLGTSSLVTRLTNDITQIQNFINGCMRILVKAPITCVGAICLIVIRTPGELPVVGLVLVLAAALIALNMKLGYPRFNRMQQKLDRLNDTSREYLSSVRVVKAFGREAYEEERFGRAAEELAGAGTSAMRVNACFSPLLNLAVNSGIVLILWLGGYQGGAVPVGRLMASVNYMTQILMSVGMISNILNMMVRAVASSNRVNEALTEEILMKEPEEGAQMDPARGIRFEDVSFSYLNSPNRAVRHLSFAVEAGQTLGIIGATGSGKSTLVNLVPRFYDATEGRVLVGGRDVRQLLTKDLRARTAVVSQKAVLFTGTIADNLRWGDREADEALLRKAARAACADEFIEGFPEGYQTMLGQGGVNLSGGQKQRLSIARALLRRPEILVLDDCTSALDAVTEEAVMRGIREFSEGVTTLLVSQRISSVMRADKILCMEDGEIVGEGTHRQLMESCPVYREIYQSQIGGDQNG